MDVLFNSGDTRFRIGEIWRDAQYHPYRTLYELCGNKWVYITSGSFLMESGGYMDDASMIAYLKNYATQLAATTAAAVMLRRPHG